MAADTILWFLSFPAECRKPINLLELKSVGISSISFLSTRQKCIFFHHFYNGRGFICVQMLRKMCTAYCLMTDLDPLEFLGYLLLFTRQK